MPNSLKMTVKRKTEQEKNEISKLLPKVIAKIAKHKATSYEISKVVDMTEPGIKKIMNGTTKFPNIDILKQIDSYIVTNYEKVKSQVSEIGEKYESPGQMSPDLLLIIEKLELIEDKIDKASLRQEIIFEIIKNAKREELLYMDKMIKEKLSS